MRIRHLALHHYPCFGTLCQLFQRGADPNPAGNCGANPLYASRWHYRPYHVVMYAFHVYYSTLPDTPAIFRDILVHTSPLHPIPAWIIYSRNQLLRSRYQESILALCRKTFLEALYRVRGLEMGAGRWWTLPHGALISRDSGSARDGDHQ